MLKKIAAQISEKELQEHLKAYCDYAKELGATDAKVIPSRDVIVDERVLMKCTYPKCPCYGTCLNCPPYAMPPEQTQRVVNKYQYGVFVLVKSPIDVMVGEVPVKSPGVGNPYRRKLAEAVAKIEARAFYDGHHLALGFSGGTCKYLYCLNVECSGLVKGQACRNSMVARSSMEAVGMDAYRMAARVGWEVYPLGKTTQPADAPHGVRLGLVMID